MNKLSARQKMRAMFIAQKVVEVEVEAIRAGAVHPMLYVSAKCRGAGRIISGMAQYPAKMFRADKPAVDSRRARRFAYKGRVLNVGSLPTGSAV